VENRGMPPRYQNRICLRATVLVDDGSYSQTLHDDELAEVSWAFHASRSWKAWPFDLPGMEHKSR
jgi:hypothetical protein